MNLYCIIFGFIFLILGIAFFIGAGQNWIEAWHKMSKEEKYKIHMNELGKNVGCIFWAASIIFLASGFNFEFMKVAFMRSMIAWFILTGIDVAFITKSNRYKLE